MKRLLPLLFALLFALALAGCNNTPDPEPSPADVSGPVISSEVAGSPSPSPASSETGDPYGLGRAGTAPLTFSLEGMEETVEATLVAGNLTKPVPLYSMFADLNLFSFASGTEADRLSYTLNPDLYMEFTFVPDITANSLHPSFIDRYIDFTDVVYSGFNPVGASGSSAFTILAESADAVAEAYLFDVADGVFAVALHYPPEAAEGGAARLHAMLDTLEVYDG